MVMQHFQSCSLAACRGFIWFPMYEPLHTIFCPKRSSTMDSDKGLATASKNPAYSMVERCKTKKVDVDMLQPEFQAPKIRKLIRNG